MNPDPRTDYKEKLRKLQEGGYIIWDEEEGGMIRFTEKGDRRCKKYGDTLYPELGPEA